LEHAEPLPEAQPSQRPIRFGPFELDAAEGELRNRGVKVKLQDQPFQILQILLEQPGKIVTREELQKRIWPADTFVDFDKGLYNAIKKLREALGDDAGAPRYIETLPKRGYRFTAPLSGSGHGAQTPGPVLVTPVETDPVITPAIGQTISHYRIVRRLGGGGMGVVYEAEDIRLQRRVALKFLPDNLTRDEKALRRFEREAHAASSLNHPSICTIYEVEEQDGRPVIVMELLEGETLNAQIRRGPVSTAALLDLGIQTSEALAAAHAKGIIHRDIKPANIFMVSSGRVKVLDFGLAKAIPSYRQEIESKEESLTDEGVLPGTTAYMSPEQVRGDEIDGRSDLFSLGVVLYEAATGQRPFVGKNRVVLMNAILNEEPVTPSHVNPELPAALDAITAKALAKDRGQRYQSAAEIRADLEQLKHGSKDRLIAASSDAQAKGTARPGLAVVTPGQSDPAIVPSSRRSYRWEIVGTAALLIVLAAAGSWYWRGRPVSKLTQRDMIVLADFSNSTGDAVFDDTLKTALSISLRQSPFLNVLPDSGVARTLRQMTLPVGTKLTPEVARELCQRAGSKAYIAGSIASLGREYVLGLKAVNCQSGDTLTERQMTAASKEKVLDTLGEAASNLRGQLGESLSTVQKFDVPLAEATTPSLEALKAFSLARRAGNEKGPAAALAYDQRAIELDPNFAGAYWAAGADYNNLGELQRAGEYISKAFELREHAGEREKLGIAGGYYQSVTGELDKATQSYQELIVSYPRPETYGNLGFAFAEQGQYEKAVEITRQGMHLAPDQAGSYLNLTNYTIALQRFDETRQMIHAAQALKVDNFMVRNVLYALAFLSSDSAAMAEQQQWFAGKPDEHFGLALASDTDAYGGHLAQAREFTKRAVNAAIRTDNKENGAIYLAIAAQREAAFGNAGAARQTAAEALKLAPTSKAVQSEAALALALAGDTARAEPLARELGERFPLDTQIQSLWLPEIQAQLALDKKNPASALNALQATTPIELGLIQFLNNISCLYHGYVRGEAYLAAGQGAAAAAEFQKILDHSGIVWNCWTGALAHLGVARANALQTRSSQGPDADAARVRALAAYKDFLALWKDADPDIPILKEAKAEYAKLQ
jgi:serine/threonine protein kinase/tetratricopeptide (TPR) repeat protein